MEKEQALGKTKPVFARWWELWVAPLRSWGAEEEKLKLHLCKEEPDKTKRIGTFSCLLSKWTRAQLISKWMGQGKNHSALLNQEIKVYALRVIESSDVCAFLRS